MDRDIPKIMKLLRKEVCGLSTKKLMKLDFGDRAFVFNTLERLLSEVCRLQRISEAGCSQLIELLEYQNEHYY